MFLCFTPFSLGPSILLVSSSRDVPIVSTWTAQLLPLLFPSPPFSPIAYSDRLSPGSPACTTGLSCQMPLSTSASIFANKTFPAGLLLAMVSKSSAKCKIVFVSNTNTAATIIQVYHLDTKRSRISKSESIVFSVIRIGMPTRILSTVL